jgi:hypothetical protein
MAGLKKAKCEQAYVKIAVYGKTGSGKTLCASMGSITPS